MFRKQDLSDDEGSDEVSDSDNSQINNKKYAVTDCKDLIMLAHGAANSVDSRSSKAEV